MTAREKLAGMFPSRTLGEAVADEVLAEHRAELAEEFAAALLAVEPFGWALAGQYAGHDAAALIRRMAAPTTTQLPEAGARCGTCGHSGSDHQHADTACWVHLPKHPSDAVKICGCGTFTPTTTKEQ